MTYYKDKIIAVTGAASGIGRAVALRLANEGALVALADFDAKGLQETVEMMPDSNRIMSTALDVSNQEAVEKWADSVVAHFGGIDAAINNAGITVVDSADKQEITDFRRIMDVNFWGMVYGSQAFLKHMKPAQKGHIANVSSVFGLFSVPQQSMYNASKFAIRGYTESLAQEASFYGVKVHSIHPGGIDTNIVNNASMPHAPAKDKEKFAKSFKKLAKTSPEQAAAIILRGMENNKRRILIGKDAWIFDKIVRLFPVRYQHWISKRQLGTTINQIRE